MPIEKKSQKNINTWLMYLLIALTCLLVILIVSEKKEALVQILDEYSLVPREEQLTELYFEDHHSLPRRMIEGSEHTFAFTVVNHEGTDVTYGYRAYFAPQASASETGKVTVIDMGTLFVPHDTSTTTPLSFSLKGRHIGSGAIVVELLGRQEHIHFFINK